MTKTFQDQYYTFWGKQKVSQEKFSIFLKKAVTKNIFYLNRPIGKIKGIFDDRSLRIAISYNMTNNSITPFFVTDKTDKIYGENMTRKTIKNKILTLTPKFTTDIELGNYTIY